MHVGRAHITHRTCMHSVCAVRHGTASCVLACSCRASSRSSCSPREPVVQLGFWRLGDGLRQVNGRKKRG